MDLKRTPLYSCHVDAGARMVPFAGWEMPVQYKGLIEEHSCVRGQVGLFDVSHMGEVFVRGPKALAAVQWLTSNDASTLDVGQAQYTLLMNESGGVVDDLVVYRLAESEFLICVNAANRSKDFEWMLAHNPHGAELENASDAWAQIAVQGRHALSTVQALTGVDLSGVGTYRFARGSVAGVDGCIVARTGYTGEDGFEVFAPADRGADVWNALLDAGADHGVQPIGLGARDTLRLEARYPLYGHELTDDIAPWQAGLAWVTKVNKAGGFVGLDALMSRKGKASHRLVGLLVDGKRIVRDGMRLVQDGEDAGWVTSGTRSPTIGRGIALAYIRKDLFKPGTPVTVDVRGREVAAQVVKGAFYTRDY